MNAERGIWRGKIKDEMHAEHNGKWLEGDLLCAVYLDGTRDYSITSRESNVVECYLVDTSTLGEYVGLNDKSDTKIFEGDKVRLPIEDDEIIGIIKWDDYMARFIADVDDGFFIYPLSKRHAEKLEVIGNIHDPELIGGDDND